MNDPEFDSNKVFNIYKSIFEMEKLQYFNAEASIIKSEQIAEKRLPKDKDEYLNKMAFIYMLGYDIFMKKRLIEKLIDELPED